MAFKFLRELNPFLAYNGLPVDIDFKLGQFYINLSITYDESLTEHYLHTITFSLDGDNFVSFVKERIDEDDEGTVIFSDGMGQREKQSLYSKVKAFLNKNRQSYIGRDYYSYIVPKGFIDFKLIPYEWGKTLRVIKKGKTVIALYSLLFDTRYVLCDPAIDPNLFIKKEEKIEAVTEEEESAAEEEDREHQIGDDFDIVENTTNTDENNHGGNSIAHEVENGDSRDNGITEKDDNSAVPVSDTADDTTENNQTDGFQNADGESGDDSAVLGNSNDTILDNSDRLSSSNGENCPQTTLTPDETAGSQDESLIDAQGAEGKIADTNELENAQKGFTCGEGVLNIIEEFLNERSFNTPRDSKDEAQSLVDEYKKEKMDEKVFRKLNGIFKKHLSVSSLGKESPTLDKKLLIKKFMSFQSPYTAFKKDMANEKVLLLIDVSGSMTNFYDLIPYFYRLSVVLKDIIVVVNLNMYPEVIIDGGKVYDVVKEVKYNPENAEEAYSGLLRKYSIKTIVNFTDFDGVDLTADILAKTNANMVIMDVYSCNVLNYKPFKDKKFKKLPEMLMPYRNKITYYYGVGSFEGVIEILNKEL